MGFQKKHIKTRDCKISWEVGQGGKKTIFLQNIAVIQKFFQHYLHTTQKRLKKEKKLQVNLVKKYTKN